MQNFPTILCQKIFNVENSYYIFRLIINITYTKNFNIFYGKIKILYLHVTFYLQLNVNLIWKLLLLLIFQY